MRPENNNIICRPYRPALLLLHIHCTYMREILLIILSARGKQAFSQKCQTIPLATWKHDIFVTASPCGSCSNDRKKKYPVYWINRRNPLCHFQKKGAQTKQTLQCTAMPNLEEGWKGPIQSTMRGRKRVDYRSSPLGQAKLQMIQ